MDQLLQVLCIKGRAKPEALEAAIEADPTAAIEQCEQDGLVENTKLGLPHHRPRPAARRRAVRPGARARAGGDRRGLRDVPPDQRRGQADRHRLADARGRRPARPQRPSGPGARRERHRPAARHRRQGRRPRWHRSARCSPASTATPAACQRALDQIRDGDHTMVAAPIKDSYHTVWFELHEELIVLSGRERTE